MQGKFKDEEKQISAKQQFEMHTKAEEYEEFTKEDLEKKWKDFSAQYDDRPNLQSTLSKVPELKEDQQLYLEIDNSFQQESIASIKPKLIAFLRRELKNSKIELNVHVTEKIKNRIIYTDEDKYGEMVKKNKNLQTLRQKLNLDLGEI